MLPEGPAPLPVDTSPQVTSPEGLTQSTSSGDSEDHITRTFIQLTKTVRLRLTETVHTAANAFGLSRIYYGRPARIPDEVVSLDSAGVDSHSWPPVVDPGGLRESLWPYPNISAWRLGDWFWNGGDTKSKAGLKTLVNDVLLANDFVVKDLTGISWDAIDEELAHGQPTPISGQGWMECSVCIQVPSGIKPSKANQIRSKCAQGGNQALGSQAPWSFSVGGIWRRPIMAIIRSVFSDDSAAIRFHFEPFRHVWQVPGGSGEYQRVYDNLYNSDAFLAEHDSLQNSRREPGCNLPRVIAALMLWSDSTHLAQFGMAQLWPVYLYFGNQAKTERCSPSAEACHHVAYMPKVCTSCYQHIVHDSFNLNDSCQIPFKISFVKFRVVKQARMHC
jgi:Plavaka transposase